MDMIFYAAYLNRGHLMILSDATDIRPHPILDIWNDKLRPVLGTENEMVETLGVCICHLIRASLTRRDSLLSKYRGRRPTAKFERRYRDETEYSNVATATKPNT